MNSLSKFLGGSLVLAAAIALVPTHAGAVIVVQEQFDYATGPVAGNNGGTGFSDPWTVTGWSRNYEINTLFAPNPGQPGSTTNANGGLDFPGLPTAGSALSRFGTAGQREAHRTLSGASQALLTADNSTIWFSVLAGAPSGNKFGTLIFGTDPMLAVRGASNNGNLSSSTGQAFGIGFRTENGANAGGGTGSPNAVAFINSESATVDVGSFLPSFAGGATHHDTSLIVGRIDWNPNGTADMLYLFNVTSVGDAEPALGDAIATLSADFDQSNFNTIGLWDTGASLFDEIRFGTSYADVIGIPEPSGIALLGLGGLAILLRRRR
ncbi:MAG: PEP-CTERM sorting domain-containing protein [Akkermansiaceae bacterium]